MRSVLGAWLAAHGDPAKHHLLADVHDIAPIRFEHPPGPDAAQGLGAIAAVLDVPAAASEQFAVGAVVALGDGAACSARTVGRIAGAAGLRGDAFADAPMDARSKLAVAGGLSHAGAHATAADALNELFAEGVHRLEYVETSLLASTVAAGLDPHAALRLWASVTPEPALGSFIGQRRQRWCRVLVEYLTGEHAPDPDAVTAALTEGPVLSKVHGYADLLLAVEVGPSTPASDVLFEAVVGDRPAGPLAAAARSSSGAWVATWAKLLDRLVCERAEHPAHRSELWAAALVTIDGFAGTSAEAVEVAAAVCGG